MGTMMYRTAWLDLDVKDSRSDRLKRKANQFLASLRETDRLTLAQLIYESGMAIAKDYVQDLGYPRSVINNIRVILRF